VTLPYVTKALIMKTILQKYALLTITILILTACAKNQQNQALINAAAQSVLPTADFDFTITNGPILPITINFTNKSHLATSYTWYFGDGTLSFDPNPTHTYTAATYSATTPYMVKLIVSNGRSTDSITRQINLGSSVITGINVTGAMPTTVITISGINFSPNVAGSSITFNGVPAIINSETATTITVSVPVNATSGPLILNTNGVSITTSFSVYSIATNLLQPINLKHISIWSYSAGYDYSYEMNGDAEADSVYYQSYSREGFVGQFVWSSGGYDQRVPAGVKIWGLTNNFAVGSNDFRIYQYGNPATVFAGNGVSGYADGQGTAAQFVAPRDMIADAAGNLYVNDAHRIRKITTGGMVSTLAGSGADGHTDGQGTSATFGDLYGITIDAAGNIYVSDTKYHNIRKISPSGTVTTLAGSGVAGFADGIGIAAQFNYPKGITVDFLGDIFVSDSNYNNSTGPYTSTIRMINTLGMVTTVLNSNKGDRISDPDGLCFFNGLTICNTLPGSPYQGIISGGYVAK